MLNLSDPQVLTIEQQAQCLWLIEAVKEMLEMMDDGRMEQAADKQEEVRELIDDITGAPCIEFVLDEGPH